MTKAESIMNKIAAEDTRPKPGFWAKGRAVSRAMRTEKDGKTNRFADSEELFEKKIDSKGMGKGSLIGAGVGGATGAAIGAMSGRMRSVGAGALLFGGIGALVGANAGDTAGKAKATREYLAERGITRGHGWNFTPKAAKNYIHQKYQGGGWDPKTRTSH